MFREEFIDCGLPFPFWLQRTVSLSLSLCVSLGRLHSPPPLPINFDTSLSSLTFTHSLFLPPAFLHTFETSSLLSYFTLFLSLSLSLSLSRSELQWHNNGSR
ncbi:hypothetical protein BT93_F1778 [Corymbia citriodora subsp. variegata]|nr:hypothetical protein BT93_F1778 [Corymbia citriodora subsp. variegata]